MLHLTGRRATEHDAPLKEEKRIASALIDLMAEYLGAGQERCDVDIVPLGVGGRDVQSGNVVEILLNAEVRDRLLR